MTPEEIRSKTLNADIKLWSAPIVFGLEILQEIAGQLAELNAARMPAAMAAPPTMGHWTREAPTEPGWYWYRDVSGMQITNAEYSMGYADPEHIVFTIVGIGDAFNGEIMLRHGGEFWSEKLEEPK